jgi:putative transposase
MPRRLRVASGGYAYHVLNRAVGRGVIFEDDADYMAMERVLARTYERLPIRIVSYCLMPSHWHLVLWPERDGQLSEFMRLLTVTHTQRHHAHHHTAGYGPLYQGRFKSFPIQDDEHFLTVCRYVERNALRAGRVKSARQWPWGSLGQRLSRRPPTWLLPMKDWPVQPGGDWAAWVNRVETAAELEAMRLCVRRGRPFGNNDWQQRTAKRLDLESTLQALGRPKVKP